MSSKVALTVLILFVLCASSTEAASIGRTGLSLRCQCIKTTSKFIHPMHMINIEIIPSGPHCENTEIIASLKNNDRVCLNPTAPWLKKVLSKMMKKSK
ncbi:interleukin-8-like [Stegostoma tigrinum]|uniref:interleukin-8-like n=1 Tax=Stegostoma tigrinum TaxID=3053191 RepID=UPI00202AF3B8|nr:interleukin-8-like [Stegostoma tigrinum]XP_059507170.1 interleukin-8-like [Stegostoma tigrinum]